LSAVIVGCRDTHTVNDGRRCRPSLTARVSRPLVAELEIIGPVQRCAAEKLWSILKIVAQCGGPEG